MSAVTAIIAPTGRGEEPHVRTTVATATEVPAASQASMACWTSGKVICQIYSRGR